MTDFTRRRPGCPERGLDVTSLPVSEDVDLGPAVLACDAFLLVRR